MSLFPYFLFRVIGSLGEAFYGSSANSLLAKYFVQTRGRAMAVHQSALYAGMIAAGILGTLIAQEYHWHLSFLVPGWGGFLVVFLMLLSFSRAKDVRHETYDFRELPSVLRKPSVLMVAVVFGLKLFVTASVLTWMPDILHVEYGVTLQNSGLYTMGLIFGFAYAGTLLGGYIADRWDITSRKGRLRLQWLALMAEAPIVLCLGFPMPLLPKLMILATYGFTSGLYDANIFSVLYEFVPEKLRSSITSITVMVGFVLSAPAPLLFGQVASANKRMALFSPTALLYLASLFLFFWVLKVRFEKDVTEVIT